MKVTLAKGWKWSDFFFAPLPAIAYLRDDYSQQIVIVWLVFSLEFEFTKKKKNEKN